jgi:hypothetical protein
LFVVSGGEGEGRIECEQRAVFYIQQQQFWRWMGSVSTEYYCILVAPVVVV